MNSLCAVSTLPKGKNKILYFDRALQGKKNYRKNGERYIVNPLGLIYSGDNFYLICFHDKYKDVAHYRIDKMDGAQTETEKITELEQYRNFDIAAYRNELFSMYAGERTEIELSFQAEMLPAIIERFGDEIKPAAEKDGKCYIRVTVRISKAFFSWLAMYEGNIKIKAPEGVRQEYIAFLQNLIEKA